MYSNVVEDETRGNGTKTNPGMGIDPTSTRQLALGMLANLVHSVAIVLKEEFQIRAEHHPSTFNAETKR